MKKEEKLVYSIGNIDEKFIEEAASMKAKRVKKRMDRTTLKRVVSIVILVGVALFLFFPLNNNGINTAKYKDSEYYSLIKTIEPYRKSATALPYDNTFEIILDFFTLFGNIVKGDASFAPGAVPEDDMGANRYVETTDNQVAGVIEADIIKTTKTHLFHITEDNLVIYKMDGENTEYVGMQNISSALNAKMLHSMEMYLTNGGESVVVVADYRTQDNERKVGVVFLGVHNPAKPYLSGTLSIDGNYNTSRLVGDKLLLVSEYYFNPKSVDYDDPATYVPTVTQNGRDSLLTMDQILAPDGINASRYSVVAAIDVNYQKITEANGLLNFTNSVYVSENNVYVTRNYNKTTEPNSGRTITETMTDIAVLGYTDGGFDRRVVTLSGTVLNQYSMDEKDGHLRVVTTTARIDVVGIGMISTSPIRVTNASLYIVDLESCATIASVESFAPDGEEAVSVRFDGDTLYVCTAVVATMTDPVFFFDLSDYGNITYTDTGVIEGFSTSLINLGEGFLLGIGRENWQYNKVEVYEEQAGQVVSVAEFMFDGDYSENYKDYLIDREKNLFGFVVFGDSKYQNSYILLQFDGYELNVVTITDHVYYNGTVRGILRGDYLYVVDNGGIVVVDLSVPYGEEGHIAKIVH